MTQVRTTVLQSNNKTSHLIACESQHQSLVPHSHSIHVILGMHHQDTKSVLPVTVVDQDDKKNVSSKKHFSCSVTNCLRCSIIATFIFTFILICYALLRQYLPFCLKWIQERENDNIALVAFVLLYTLVSLPFTWGYIVVNVATGYLYGFINGLAVTLLTATTGVCIAHTLMKCCLRTQWLKKILFSSDTFQQIHLLLSCSKAFKLVMLSRLTPIPFGFQNAVFALGDIPTFQYLIATFLGLFPCQILNLYMGTTLRSMEEVFHSNLSSSKSGLYVLLLQMIIAIVVGLIIVRKAKEQLARIQEEQATNKVMMDTKESPQIVLK
ncbi:transmembrane protein 64 [Lepeophtheirus salmonis]|uniref:transmembrane protein 64 n=1 Tax=Lepeophtheirus salmonis TaxID=72036 RepID=UPI001AEA20E0|nr:transmembrane protein 64-like [Lepeophtheirus salmonis]